MNQVQHIACGPAEAVEAMHDQFITHAQKLQNLCQLAVAVAGSSRPGLGANDLAACSPERGFLDIEILAGRADAGVSDPRHGQSVTLAWLRF